MTKAIEVTDANYEETIQGDLPVIIDFWAEWCGPCKMMAPVLDELAKDFEGKAVIGKMNVDENSQTPTKHGIRSIPTLIFVKNGEVVDKQVGVVGKSVLAEKLQQLV